MKEEFSLKTWPREICTDADGFVSSSRSKKNNKARNFIAKYPHGLENQQIWNYPEYTKLTQLMYDSKYYRWLRATQNWRIFLKMQIWYNQFQTLDKLSILMRRAEVSTLSIRALPTINVLKSSIERRREEKDVEPLTRVCSVFLAVWRLTCISAVIAASGYGVSSLEWIIVGDINGRWSTFFIIKLFN